MEANVTAGSRAEMFVFACDVLGVCLRNYYAGVYDDDIYDAESYWDWDSYELEYEYRPEGWGLGDYDEFEDDWGLGDRWGDDS